MFNFDDAKNWEIVDLTSDVTSGVRHDDFGKMVVLIFVGGEDFLASDVISDVECHDGGLVNIAMIVEEGANTDWCSGGEFWYVVFDNRTFVGDFARNVGVDDASQCKDIINGYTFRILASGIGSDHNSGILAASVGVFGDVNGKFYFAGFIWRDSASRISDSDPISNFRESRNIANIGLVIFADHVVG